MDTETAHMALRFLERINIQGNEAPAFMKVVNALNDEAASDELPDEIKDLANAAKLVGGLKDLKPDQENDAA